MPQTACLLQPYHYSQSRQALSRFALAGNREESVMAEIGLIGLAVMGQVRVFAVLRDCYSF